MRAENTALFVRLPKAISKGICLGSYVVRRHMKSIKRSLSCTAGIYPHDSRLDVKVSGPIYDFKAKTEGISRKLSTLRIYIFRREEDDPRVAFLPLCFTTSDDYTTPT